MPFQPHSTEQPEKPTRFELRISAIYAAVFMPLGVHLAYFPLWLEASGFRAEQIGVILSLPMFVRVVTTPMITSLADRVRERGVVLRTLTAASFAFSLGYFLPPAYLPVLALSVALQAMWAPLSPLSDSVALSGVRRFGSNYPKMRVWGSIAFLVGNLVGGFILAATNPGMVPVMVSIGLAGAFAASLLVPRLGPVRRTSVPTAGVQAPQFRLFTPYLLLFLAGSGIINASHAFLYGFVSIYWKSIGLNDGVIGALWAWSVLAEVFVFMAFTRVFGKARGTTIMIVAGSVAILRWLMFPFVEPLGFGVPGFVVVQAMHALSMGVLLIGVQKVIGETVPEERTGAAQGISIFTTGTGTAIVMLLSGPLYPRLGASGFFVMAAIAVAGLALVLLAARSAPEKRRGRQHG